MEDTSASFVLLKSRKEGLRGAYEQLRSQASSFLEFGLKCQEYEESLNSEFEKLAVRRKEIALKEEEFIIVEKSLRECSENLESKTKQIHGVLKSLEECQQELKSKKEQLHETNTLISEKDEELEHLVKRLESTMNLTKEYDEEIEKKEKIRYLLEQSIEERSAQLDLKEMRLHKLAKNLEDCTKKLQEKQKQLKTVQRNLAGYNDDVKVKKSEGWPIQSDSATHHDEPKQKMNQLQSTRRLITDAGEEFTSEEGKLNLLHKSLHELVSKQKDADHFRERTKMPEAREKQKLVSDQRSVEEEMLLRPKGNALLHHPKPESNARDEEHTQFVTGNVLKMYEKVPSELYSAVVQKSHDPAESALLLMKEMYPLHARRRSIFLLNELRKTCPLISCEVRKEAINFARDWKQKSTVGDTVSDDFDALAYLKFLDTFKLKSYFERDELLRILKLIDQQTESQDVPVNDNGKGIKRLRKDDAGKASSPRIR